MPHEADAADFRDVLGSLHSLLLTQPRVEEFLVEAAELVARSVDPPASCGITTRYDRQPVTVAASDARAAIIDEQQYGAGVGPCLQAMETGQVVEVPDQRSDGRWQPYGERAVAHGVRCSLSLPLTLADRTVGALNLYSYERPHAFADQVDNALLVAAQVSSTLDLAIRHTRMSDHSEQLEQALVSRSVIDQAIGLLMGQQHCDATTAFALLRARSQTSNLRVREVAAEILERYSGGASPPHRFGDAFAPERDR